MWPYIIVLVVTAALIVGVVAMLRRKKSAGGGEDEEHQMLSFVALLEEPRHLEPIMLQTAARRAWDVELGIGEEESEDGFIAGEPGVPTMVVMTRGRGVMVNNFSAPYVENPEDAAASIPDMRLRDLVARHTAWMSCDALGVESFDDIEEVRSWYQLLGPLLSEMVDDNCLAILLPQTGQIFPNLEETLEMLKADDPLDALMEDAPVPVVPIKDDDPRMIAAVQEARDKWPQFVTAFEQRGGDNFSVKAPISGNGNTEFIWLEVTAIENGVVFGELANEPMDLGKLKLGSRVRTTEDEINDWAYFADDEAHGMFTVKVLTEAQGEMNDDE